MIARFSVVHTNALTWYFRYKGP